MRHRQREIARVFAGDDDNIFLCSVGDDEGLCVDAGNPEEKVWKISDDD